LDLAEQRPVAVVVVLDDLERPAALDDIAAEQVALDAFGDVVATGVTQGLHGLAERDVGAAGQLVERVQVPTRALTGLQRLGDLTDRVDDLVRHACGRRVLGRGELRGLTHGFTVPEAGSGALGDRLPKDRHRPRTDAVQREELRLREPRDVVERGEPGLLERSGGGSADAARQVAVRLSGARAARLPHRRPRHHASNASAAANSPTDSLTSAITCQMSQYDSRRPKKPRGVCESASAANDSALKPTARNRHAQCALAISATAITTPA